MAAGNQWKHLEFSLPLKKFILSTKLEYIRIGTSLNILLLRTRKHKANRCFRARNMLPRNNADVTHCEKTVVYFQRKAVHRAEDRPTDICLKMAFT